MAGERDELLTINQVSALLHIPVQSIYTQRKFGTFARRTAWASGFYGAARS
jgi:hypothetical protein